MAHSHLPRFVFSLAASLLLLPAGAAWGQETASGASADRAEIVHVLNRVTFGPRPGDVEAVEKMGLHNYINQQLHPETIDDSAVEQEVAQFEMLQMSPQELTTLFLEERKKNFQKQKQAAALAQNPPAGQPP